MKTRLVTALIPLALAAFGASSGSAQASLVAGWDFSQYAGDGFMSIDGGSTFTSTLSANYSDLDPTFGAGFESAAFGTMYVDGSFGSTPVAAGSGSEQFLPSAAVGGSLVSNIDAPSLVDFDAFSVLQSEGQLSAESLAMIAPSAASVVFEADLTGASRTGSNWLLTFGGRTFSGSSSVAVEFSNDGTTFTSFGSANLTTVDALFTIPLGTASSDLAYVRLTFAPVGADQPLIDNVALSADLSTPTTTTTTTTPTSTTTTSTTVPGSTTTTIATASTTTTSTTTTIPAPSTTTTTLPPSGDLSGRYSFVDRNIGDANTSFLSLDTDSGKVCVAGQVLGTDGATSVSFSYQSLGSIRKATEKTASGDFVSVNLTLDISSGLIPPAPPYRQTTQLECWLIKASLLKEGARSKVRLGCELGENFSFFPNLTSEQITHIDNAFAHRKGARVSKKSRLKISHVGVPTDGDGPVTCSLPPT